MRSDNKDVALEELRDLSFEVDGEESVGEAKKWQVKALAWNAFMRAGELKQTLEMLNIGTNEASLKACV